MRFETTRVSNMAKKEMKDEHLKEDMQHSSWGVIIMFAVVIGVTIYMTTMKSGKSTSKLMQAGQPPVKQMPQMPRQSQMPKQSQVSESTSRAETEMRVKSLFDISRYF